MQHVIYLDVYFAINFLMDYFILIIAKQLLKNSGTIKKNGGSLRCVCAAAFGALYATFILVSKVRYGLVQMFVTYILVALLMTGIAFALKNRTDLIKAAAVVYIVTFLLNGAVNYIHYNSSWGRTVIQATTKRLGGVSLLMTITAAICVYAIINTAVRFLVGNMKIERKLYHVRIVKGNGEVRVKALCDTGNSLREPYRKKPVSVLQYDVIKDILQGDERIIMIPYNAVGTKNGMLIGIIADYMEVTKEGFSNRVANPVIGLYQGILSSRSQYEMLLHPDLTMGEGEEDDDKCIRNKKEGMECNQSDS